jgi:hypothetical protein
LIPRKQLCQIDEELADLVFCETEAEPTCGCNQELVQGTLMFHVEPLRETVEEVKVCFIENGLRSCVG